MSNTNDLSESDFLSRVWWQQLAVLWNSTGERHVLGGIGYVQIFGTNTVPTTLHFDCDGNLSVVHEPHCRISSFIASDQTWREFVSGMYTAADAVLNGQIQFSGTLSDVAPYIKAFEVLGKIARTQMSLEH